MTDRDSRTNSGGASDGALESPAPSVRIQVATGIVEQPHHGLAAMIAGDVRMQVLPDALDAVGVGAVGWEEVEYYASPKSGEGLACASRLMDAVVVDDQ